MLLQLLVLLLQEESHQNLETKKNIECNFIYHTHSTRLHATCSCNRKTFYAEVIEIYHIPCMRVCVCVSYYAT